MIHDVGTLLDVAIEEANIRRRYSTKINNINQIQQCTESIPQDQRKAPFCCSVFHQSSIVYIRALILGNRSTLIYTKKSKETRVLKNFEFKREVGIDHYYKK